MPVVALLSACTVAPMTGVAPARNQFAEAHHNELRDMRGEFRAALCRRMADSAGECQAALANADGEPPPAASPPHGGVAGRYRVAIVPGIFAECLAPESRPLVEAARALRADGLVVHELMVPARGSVARNGEVLLGKLTELNDDPRPLIVVAYSKGLPDVLEALRRKPELQQQVAAVVSWAGAAHGSPLAEQFGGAYRMFLAHLPIAGCEPGNGEEVHDLTPAARRAWWTEHGHAIRVPLYSLVALPSPQRLSPALVLSHHWLSSDDPRNDGQLLWRDAIMSPGTLLAFLNADHWGVAMPLGKALPLFDKWLVDELPRPAVLQATIDVIAADLAHRP